MIIRSISTRLLAGLALFWVVGLVGQVSLGAETSINTVLYSLVLAEGLTLGWFGTSMVTNPLGGSYLRRLAGGEPVFTPSQPDSRTILLDAALGLGEVEVAATLTDSESRQSFAVVAMPGALTTLLAEQETGDLSLVSLLSDNRLVATSALMIVPSEGLLVNFVPGASANELMSAHSTLLKAFTEKGFGPKRSSAAISVELLRLESRAMVALGPVAGSFLGMRGESKLVRLLVSPSPRDVLSLGLRHKHGSSQSQRSQTTVPPTPMNSARAVSLPV